MKDIIDRVRRTRQITAAELELLLKSEDREVIEYLFAQARQTAQSVFGKHIYIRGLIEFTNVCKNDCYYCGIRKSNKHVQRYRLTKESIL